ncbi:tRNA cyclic N6-threonylcarbamoyladenosine(37) synthase TcdA [Pseudomaricurvus alkylphenolicus]|jgi:tRNA A37 threonylcarbamoyladenosine dehydratase|uniref:tRNA cyclic N6-threonylcarbamoyladenosine(37) synthase TcdA n=1 Tax=Pseudomaricurvus alkylphenolicus TaxID=1306991 RepID=UPI00141F9E3F|nr:tRNA cyclic N6-threonylcarbamoyladenosine(37) synthase TcdA [Pseudomaricurvus alkylphenolicus]NIB44262.1 tRNA cyclic N6-threonylcarbamoyladenosine(37) synthase TcdA [Pseudomaricurvus alkylphenolicus]
MKPLSEHTLQRFGGIARLYGMTALEHLQRAHFAVIGIGGVGTWVAEALARSGVGEITLVDMDDICLTNTNRQIHALQSTIGRQKIDVMAERLRDINPEIKLHCVDDFLDRDNLLELIHSDLDLVVDAIDAAYVKAALISHCKRQKQLMVTVGSAGGKLDPRQIVSGDLAKTINDPLLAKTRNNLRRLHGFSRNPKRVFSIEAVYSTEQMTYPDQQGGTCQSKSGLENGVKLDCSGGFGAATMVTASFGFVAVSRAIDKYLLRCQSRDEARTNARA